MKEIKIKVDAYPVSPRKDDNVGVMCCASNKYTLGDKQIDTERHGGWESVLEELQQAYKTDVILPLHLYDHSGITIATHPFSCKWDSGQVGYIVADKKAYGCKRVGKKLREKLFRILEDEVKEYDMYLRGNVYVAELWENGERTDSVSSILADSEEEALKLVKGFFYEE